MMTYGYSVREGKDPYVDLVDKAVNGFTASTTPGAFWVDILPVLQSVPSWFPGANFKRLAAEWRKDTMEMVEAPYAMVKEQVVSKFQLMLRSFMMLT